MKKLLIAIAVMLTAIMTSCGGTDLKSLDEKFEKGDENTTFTQSEYEAMISYLDELYSNPEKVQEIAGTKEDLEVAARIINYGFALAIAKDEGKLDKCNLEKYENTLEKTNKVLEVLKN